MKSMKQNSNGDPEVEVEVEEDEHDHDMVMPGFRFHPTEEELIQFYLRRKVEGKPFNVELITSLDLYRYDPWHLPAMAAIGEKEWFFYVPRDKKYRNGDRPNRVTTSGYWKATGADRMIRSENSRSIGLKKTLVFYSGKAPKGVRSSWIMNEYRLPHHDTQRYQKTEISLCRVYKRPGVDDHQGRPSTSSLPRTLPSTFKQGRPTNFGAPSLAATTAAISNQFPTLTHHHPLQLLPPHDQQQQVVLDHAQEEDQLMLLNGTSTNTNNNISTSTDHLPGFDDLHRLVNYQQNDHQPASYLQMWDWNPLPQPPPPQHDQKGGHPHRYG
ncbi:NAC domain-containing protein 35 [Linum grandiflorum]